mmetsp:Transcript_42653/g.70940  ORF Transcript_42653/g.70940 Transcript_42653/m.70940 type:complete len:87 (+) Transcript_42653:69-329(+)
MYNNEEAVVHVIGGWMLTVPNWWLWWMGGTAPTRGRDGWDDGMAYACARERMARGTVRRLTGSTPTCANKHWQRLPMPMTQRRRAN